MVDSSIKIKRFDLQNIPSNSVVMIIGKRGTGKTTLTADIMHALRNRFDAGVCFSSTEESNSYWQNHICDTMIYPEFDNDIYHNFISEQRRINGRSAKPINSFALFEDCMYSKLMRNNKDIRGTFFNGRHWNIFLVVTMQYVLDLPPELRSNVDFVFILRNNMVADRERLWKHFCGFIPTLGLFHKIMNKCTSGYECLVVNNMSKSNEISDCLYWYEGALHNDFKVGKRTMWEYHYRMKRNEETREYGEEDLDYYDSLLHGKPLGKSSIVRKVA